MNYNQVIKEEIRAVRRFYSIPPGNDEKNAIQHLQANLLARGVTAWINSALSLGVLSDDGIKTVRL